MNVAPDIIINQERSWGLGWERYTNPLRGVQKEGNHKDKAGGKQKRVIKGTGHS